MTVQSRPLILVLERDPAVAASLAFALRLEGFRVEVHVAPEAIEQAAGEQSSCLFIDADHPAVSPIDLLARARARGFKGHAIFSATHPTRRLGADVRASGARLLEKPWSGEGLIAEVRSAITAGGQSQPAGQETCT